MEIRRVKVSDVDNLVNNRTEFICSIRKIPNVDEFAQKTKLYLMKNIRNDSLISYIALEGGKIVSSSILCIYTTLPTPSCINGKTGLLLNVYTLKEYRRQGLAYKILTEVIEEAQKKGVFKIQLDYTDDGYELYRKLGFKSLDREMVLRLG